MIRLSTIFWIAFVGATAFGMFMVKYGVQDLEDELGRVRKQTVAAQQEIRVLNAEWSYLTQPERLADLNRRFLTLAPIQTKQYQQDIAEVPLRALPPEDPVLTGVSPTQVAPIQVASALPTPQAPAPAAAVQALAAPVLATAASAEQVNTAPVAVVAADLSSAATGSRAALSEMAKPAVATANPTTMAQLVKSNAGATSGTSARVPRSLDDLVAEIYEGR